MFRCSVAFGLIAVALVPRASAQDEVAPRPRWDLRRAGAITSIAFSPDGKSFFSAGDEGKVLLWDVARQRVVREFVPRGRVVRSVGALATERRRIESIDVSPDGRLLVECSTESPGVGAVRIWDVETDGPPRVLDDKVRNPRCAIFSPDGKWVVANARDGDRANHKLVVWDAATGTAERTLRDDRLATTLLAFSPDGKTLASGGGTKLLLWDFDAGVVRSEIRGIRKAIQYIAFSPDGERIGVVSDDDMIHIWSAADGTLVREWRLEQGGVSAVAISVTNRTVATAGKDRSVKLWNPATGRRLKTMWGHADRVLSLAFAPDGKTLVSGGADGLIAFWDIDEASYKDQDDTKTKEEIEAEKKRAQFERDKKKEKEQKDSGEGGGRRPRGP